MKSVEKKESLDRVKIYSWVDENHSMFARHIKDVTIEIRWAWRIRIFTDDTIRVKISKLIFKITFYSQFS